MKQNLGNKEGMREMEKLELSQEWLIRFMSLTIEISKWSKDPKRKVGCLIVDNDKNILSEGYNGFPREIRDDERLNDTFLKLKIIQHAEANAISSAARNGHNLKGSIAFVNRFLCSQCAGLMIQAGVKFIVVPKEIKEDLKSKWKEDWNIAKGLLKEAGIIYIKI